MFNQIDIMAQQIDVLDLLCLFHSPMVPNMTCSAHTTYIIAECDILASNAYIYIYMEFIFACVGSLFPFSKITYSIIIGIRTSMMCINN